MIGSYIEPCFFQPSANRWQMSIPLRTNTVISCKICHQCETCLTTSSLHNICHTSALLYGKSRVWSHMVEMNKLLLCPLQCQPDFFIPAAICADDYCVADWLSCILIRSRGKPLSSKISWICIQYSHVISGDQQSACTAS